MIKKTAILLIALLFCCVSGLYAEVSFQAIHSASSDVLVAFFTGGTAALDEVNIDDISRWRINGKPASGIFLYAAAADPSDYHVYLQTSRLEEGAQYWVETPFGDRTVRFREMMHGVEIVQASFAYDSKYGR